MTQLPLLTPPPDPRVTALLEALRLIVNAQGLQFACVTAEEALEADAAKYGTGDER